MSRADSHVNRKWTDPFWDDAQKQCALPENKQWQSWLRNANRRLELNEDELKELFVRFMSGFASNIPLAAEIAAAAKAQAEKAQVEIAAAAKAQAEKVAVEKSAEKAKAKAAAAKAKAAVAAKAKTVVAAKAKVAASKAEAKAVAAKAKVAAAAKAKAAAAAKAKVAAAAKAKDKAAESAVALAREDVQAEAASGKRKRAKPNKLDPMPEPARRRAKKMPASKTQVFSSQNTDSILYLKLIQRF